MNRKERRQYLKKITTPQQYEARISQAERLIRQECEKEYKEELGKAIDTFILTIVYTLHYNEKTKFGNERIQDFMQDLLATIDNFTDGSYSPEEYREQLEKEGIKIINHKGEVE
jgi:hypothetical protein